MHTSRQFLNGLALTALAAIAACAFESGVENDDGDTVGGLDDALEAQGCNPIVPTAVTSGGDDGNKATNVFDNNASTRWSQNGKGAWLLLDFGAEQTLSGASLAWYKGDTRKNRFTVGLSSDGSTFEDAYSGTSSGASSEAESYPFATKTARYMKVTVNGNSKNNWASLIEARACSVGAVVQPPPPDPGTNPGGGTVEPPPPVPGGGQPATAYPVPAGFQTVGDFATDFKFWGRYETNYASGGSGPSERWGNKAMDMLNMVAGYEFQIGPDHGSRGDDEVTLKFPRCKTAAGDRGVYIPFIGWREDGGNSFGGVGKEFPHPTTSHLKFNVDDPKPQIGNIKDGQWHGLMAAVYNDENEVPTIELWYNSTASGKAADYVFLGRSKDTGSGSTKMTPGPVLKFPGKGGKGGHEMQIRIDEIPHAQLHIRNPYAIEVIPPTAP